VLEAAPILLQTLAARHANVLEAVSTVKSGQLFDGFPLDHLGHHLSRAV
jgi:hypothetical protein